MNEVILETEKNNAVLETVKLDKIFKLGGREVRALSDVNLQIKNGDFISIMGPSGSGKTTLLNMLGCLDRPTHGKVILEGVDLTKVPEKDLYKVRRDKVGFIFQTYNLLPYLNALENVELPMEGTATTKSERHERARHLLEMVGLSERQTHRPHRLSAGEQQRVSIARALANNPAIVLGDELTGNLDNKTKFEIIKLLGKLNKDQGTTIIMVTHDSQMANQTERMFFIHDGKLLNKEKKGALFQKNTFRCPDCGKQLPVDAKYCLGCGKKL